MIAARRHTSHPGRGRRPARLTIDIVEGRGIRVELDGDLTDGSLDQVEARLDRLSQLGFEIIVVGTSGIRSIDHRGSGVLGTFVDRVCDGRGEVLIVDPNGAIDGTADRLARATIARDEPEGAWWLS